MRRRPSLAKGLLTGIAAGLVATLAMDQFQNLIAAAQKAADKQKKLAQGESPWLVANEQAQQEIRQQESEDSTEKAARKIAAAAGTTIPKDRVKSAGQAVHYTFGTLMGICYSATAEFYPDVASGGGAAFGTILFLGAHEVAVPAFHFSDPPTETPASDHLQHWAAHIVYGGTLELARNVLRRLM
jgi:putative membrane protein